MSSSRSALWRSFFGGAGVLAFRVVLIENEVSIRVQLNNLIVTKEGEDIWIPLEDISVIVIDNLMTSVTVRTLSQLAENGIEVLICNREHLPIGYYNAYDNHSRSSKMIGYQIQRDQSFFNALWSEIIFHKIKNQSRVLHILHKDDSICIRLEQLAEELQPGDPSNRESFAAKLYFNELMGVSFSRGNENILLNSGLDYGYSIIRSFLARLCVGYGLNTQIGIHHRNEYNRFNLVDDLLEPFRPFVDLYAYRLMENDRVFTRKHRMGLINMLNHEVVYEEKKMFLCNVLEIYVQRIAGSIAGREVQTVFPNVEGYLPKEIDEV